MKSTIIKYTSHFMGSLNREVSSNESRSVFKGDIFLTETRGRRANNIEMIKPSKRPCPTAIHEIATVISTGRKSFKLLAKTAE
jgi:hypothetical protein